MIVGETKRDLPLNARWGEAGAYESVFIPTVAGPYTFHLTGTIDGTPVDESFTSSPEGFNEVQEATAVQFPVQLRHRGGAAGRGAEGPGRGRTS